MDNGYCENLCILYPSRRSSRLFVPKNDREANIKKIEYIKTPPKILYKNKKIIFSKAILREIIYSCLYFF